MSYITKGDEWMVYRLYIDGEKKPRLIYWRNHGTSYIKRNTKWERVYFNMYIFEITGCENIPMQWANGVWEMINDYRYLYD